ncbi:MAG: hypothetical protein ABFD77_02720, partial [Thermotogota bacterium]
MNQNSTTVVQPDAQGGAGFATGAEASVERAAVMTNENTMVEKGMEIARAVSKGGEAFGAEAKKAARDFLKRKRDQRARVLPGFVTKLGDEMHVPVNADDHGLEAVLRLVRDTISCAQNAATPPAPSDADVEAAAEALDTDAQQPETADEEALDETPKKKVAATPHVGIRKLDEALQQAEGRHLGDLCGWSIPGSRNKAEVDALAEAC